MSRTNPFARSPEGSGRSTPLHRSAHGRQAQNQFVHVHRPGRDDLQDAAGSSSSSDAGVRRVETVQAASAALREAVDEFANQSVQKSASPPSKRKPRGVKRIPEAPAMQTNFAEVVFGSEAGNLQSVPSQAPQLQNNMHGAAFLGMGANEKLPRPTGLRRPDASVAHRSAVSKENFGAILEENAHRGRQAKDAVLSNEAMAALPSAGMMTSFCPQPRRAKAAVWNFGSATGPALTSHAEHGSATGSRGSCLEHEPSESQGRQQTQELPVYPMGQRRKQFNAAGARNQSSPAFHQDTFSASIYSGTARSPSGIESTTCAESELDGSALAERLQELEMAGTSAGAASSPRPRCRASSDHEHSHNEPDCREAAGSRTSRRSVSTSTSCQRSMTVGPTFKPGGRGSQAGGPPVRAPFGTSADLCAEMPQAMKREKHGKRLPDGYDCTPNQISVLGEFLFNPDSDLPETPVQRKVGAVASECRRKLPKKLVQGMAGPIGNVSSVGQLVFPDTDKAFPRTTTARESIHWSRRVSDAGESQTESRAAGTATLMPKSSARMARSPRIGSFTALSDSRKD